MRTIRTTCLAVALFAVAVSDTYAAKKIPLTDARYRGEVFVSTGLGVRPEVTTFDPGEQRWSGMATSGGVYVPLSGKVKPEFLFSAQDQQALADILIAELQRLAIARKSDGSSQRELRLRLDFKDGAYIRSINEYAMSMTMRLEDGGGDVFEQAYRLNSNQNATRWQKLNTSVWKGKMQLVQVALDTLIPDIQRFLKSDSATRETRP